MSRESKLFFAWAIPIGVIGSLIGEFLDWGETAVFVAGMGPLAVVTFVFVRREGRRPPQVRSAQSAGHTRA